MAILIALFSLPLWAAPDGCTSKTIDLATLDYKVMPHADRVLEGTEIRPLIFRTPAPTARAVQHYSETVAPSTLAFVIIRGWYGGEEGKARETALVRVGTRYYRFNDDGVIQSGDYAELVLWLITRADEPMIFESVYDIPQGAFEDLSHYYEDRMRNRATIGGNVVVPTYKVEGRGIYTPGESLLENCAVFALSFAQSHWATDYPVLAKMAEANHFQVNNPDGIGTNQVATLLFTSRPITTYFWAGNALTTGEPLGQHHWELFKIMRSTQRLKLRP